MRSKSTRPDLGALGADVHVHTYPDGRVKVHESASAPGGLSRRKALGAMGATAAAAAVAPMVGASPVSADRSSPTQPAPRPILAGVEDPLLGFIHFLLPGPEGSSTPVIGIPGFGLDVDPSMITDYHGYTAFAVVAGESTTSDGKDQVPTEMDIRVMHGSYLDDNGKVQEGTYAFF